MLVIDGASRDGTLKTNPQPSPEIHLLAESDKGVYDAMNKGFHRSGGDADAGGISTRGLKRDEVSLNRFGIPKSVCF
jgi:hypothetical protein